MSCCETGQPLLVSARVLTLLVFPEGPSCCPAVASGPLVAECFVWEGGEEGRRGGGG